MLKCYNLLKNNLIDLYINQKLTIREIGKLFHCHCTTVLDYLKKYDIKRRDANHKIRIYWRGKKNLGVSKHRKNLVGILNPFYGKKHSIKSRRQMTEHLMGRETWNKGLTKETDKRVLQGSIKSNKTNKERGNSAGSKNPNWRGGIAYLPYNSEFNEILKEQIRKRDNYICQECGFNQGLLKNKLNIHHIDYNKNNNKLSNLISLCNSCHQQTNYNRNDWTKYYLDKNLDKI